MTASLSNLRYRLLYVWLIGAAITGILLVIQSFSARYDGDLDKAWSWFVPTFIPTLSLMVGVVAADSMLASELRSEAAVENRFARLAVAISVSYVAIAFFTLIASSIMPLTGSKAAVDLLLMSNYWLGPLQGLAAGVIGAVFQAARSGSKKPE